MTKRKTILIQKTISKEPHQTTTTQNHSMNDIKARIDKTQQNRKCMWCGDRDEMINHIVNECSEWALKEYGNRQDWVGKVIHWEKLQETEIWPYEQMLYTQPRICAREWDRQTVLWFWDTNRLPTRPRNNQQKTENLPYCVLSCSGLTTE